jgi:hypothetical protein
MGRRGARLVTGGPRAAFRLTTWRSPRVLEVAPFAVPNAREIARRGPVLAKRLRRRGKARQLTPSSTARPCARSPGTPPR